MSSRLPPLNPLRAFEATARNGSVTRAAEELHVTHSAVSHQIRSLEAVLGVPLFLRTSRGLRLTEPGAVLLPSVTTAFAEIATVAARIRHPATAGTLTVACPPALLSFWLLPRVGDFMKSFPEVGLTFIAANDPENIRNPAVDLCLLYGHGGWQDCWARLWSPLDVFPVASPALLNQRPLRSLRDLHGHTLLHGDADGGEWNAWLAAADARDLRPAAAHSFLGDARLSAEAAVHGLGVAIGDSVTSAGFVSRGDLVVPFGLCLPAPGAVYVVARPERQGMARASAFIDWIFAALPSGRLLRTGQIAQTPGGPR